ncbi:MAG: TetR/AcrR family transcriptional regulator [Clostridiales bacterium]|nr:TetR/AcrR family transcriptional regulator [Clostridiales bacterium]
MYHIKEDQRSKFSATLIYEGLTKLMVNKVYEEIKITEIVNAAGVGRATFYRNFDSKIDILRYQSDKIFQGLLEHLFAYHKKTPVKRSSEFLVPFLEYFDVHTDIVNLLIKANHVDILVDSMNLLFKDMYEAYKTSASHPDETWSYFIAIRSGITINILVQWIKDGKTIPPKRLGELLGNQLANSFTVDQFL